MVCKKPKIRKNPQNFNDFAEIYSSEWYARYAWYAVNYAPVGLSVKSFPVKRSSYAVLSLFLVENFQMSTSELEFTENTLFVEDFDLFQEPKHSY